MIDSKKIYDYIKMQINPYGKTFKGTIFEFGTKIMEYIKNMEKQPKVEWIPCSERMPEERDSIFVKFKGTDMWHKAMFEKISDEVNVTVELKDGTRMTKTAYTVDGKWNVEKEYRKQKVIAWQPLPEPYRE